MVWYVLWLAVVAYECGCGSIGAGVVLVCVYNSGTNCGGWFGGGGGWVLGVLVVVG